MRLIPSWLVSFSGVVALASTPFVLGSCSSSSSDSNPGESVTQDVDSSGGTITVAGATLTFPQGALALKETITVHAQTVTPPDGYVMLSEFFKCDPTGIDFQNPVTMTIPFTDDGAGKTPTVFWSSAFQPGFTDLGGTKSDDGKTVTANIAHFSSGFVGYKK